jgi:hypothetical protein
VGIAYPPKLGGVAARAEKLRQETLGVTILIVEADEILRRPEIRRQGLARNRRTERFSIGILRPPPGR